MLRKITFLSLTLLIAFASACGGKVSPQAVQDQTPNIRSFPVAFKTAWKAALDTVEFDFLMGIEMQEVKRGFFSTEMIRDYQPFQKRRFRVSGTLVFDGQTTLVKLYKHEEILVNDAWQAIPSDSKLESQILQKISTKLANKPQIKKKK